jgi:hypothetical protein
MVTVEKLIEAFTLACKSKQWEKGALSSPGHNDAHNTYYLKKGDLKIGINSKVITVSKSGKLIEDFKCESYSLSKDQFKQLFTAWEQKDCQICDIDRLIKELKEEISG